MPREVGNHCPGGAEETRRCSTVGDSGDRWTVGLDDRRSLFQSKSFCDWCSLQRCRELCSCCQESETFIPTASHRYSSDAGKE